MTDIITKLVDMSQWYCHNTVDETRNAYALEAVNYIKLLEAKIENMQKTSFVIEKKNPKCKCTDCKCQDTNARKS